ncbi:MAG: chemotaxis protein CheD [Desulfohalobiaceae bacterium]
MKRQGEALGMSAGPVCKGVGPTPGGETRVIGVGELAAGKTAGQILKTYGLGSCVAVNVFDPATKVAGMAHVALPDSGIWASQPVRKPAYYADKALPLLLRSMAALTGGSLTRGCQVKLVGGANVIGSKGAFRIGDRNVDILRELLQQLGLWIAAEDLGGTISRTVSLDVATGRVRVDSPGRTSWML